MISGFIKDGNSSIFCSQINGVSHLSEPFKWNWSGEIGAIDVSTFFCKNPFTPLPVGGYIPDISTWQAFGSCHDEFWIIICKFFPSYSNCVFVVSCCYPICLCAKDVNFIGIKMDVELLVDFIFYVGKVTHTGVIYIEATVVCNTPKVIVGAWKDIANTICTENILVIR